MLLSEDLVELGLELAVELGLEVLVEVPETDELRVEEDEFPAEMDNSD